MKLPPALPPKKIEPFPQPPATIFEGDKDPLWVYIIVWGLGLAALGAMILFAVAL